MPAAVQALYGMRGGLYEVDDGIHEMMASIPLDRWHGFLEDAFDIAFVAWHCLFCQGRDIPGGFQLRDQVSSV